MNARLFTPIFVLTAFSLAVTVCSGAAWAVRSVNSPYVTKGDLKLEWRGAYDFDSENKSQRGAQGYDLKLIYGVTDYWATEMEGEGLKSGSAGSELRLTTLEWQNRFQFTGPKDWIGSGLRLGYRRSFIGTPDRLQAKLLLAKDIGKVSSTGNLILTKEIGSGAAALQGGLALSSRYKWKSWLEPGAEWYSDFGQLRDPGKFSRQNHSAGPVFYGQLTPNLRYDIGYLFGISDAAPDGELKSRLEYKF